MLTAVFDYCARMYTLCAGVVPVLYTHIVKCGTDMG